jgi:cobalt-precorrin-5B (C1)-methyltransferase
MKSGYTLPVFACAAAIAALKWLQRSHPISSVMVDLIEPKTVAEIAIEQVAGLQSGSALAITRSDPGDNLDLTRNTPIWAMVERLTGDAAEKVLIQGGEGIGRTAETAAIYAYAKRLLVENLTPLLDANESIRVTIILPEGRQLAKRTSNEAFGVVEGLSLLGTSGIAQPLSAPDQLEAFRQELQQKSREFDCLVFCIGENGLDLAAKLGIRRDRTLKTANWLGSLLVEAGLQQVKSILLFGYHGKLIKLAGGIFHTHHHVADARQEILTAHAAKVGLPRADLQTIFQSATTEDGLKYLKTLDETNQSNWVEQIYGSIAQSIDQRSQAYIYTHSEATVQIGSVLFDRSRQILITSQNGATLLESIC